MAAASSTSERGLVVIGGGPTAFAAARAFVDSGGAGPVTVVSDDDTPPYHRPPLSKDYLRGETAAESLSLAEPGFWTGERVDLRLNTVAVGLDASARVVELDDGSLIRFTACVLATGAAPQPLPVPGADTGALLLRSLSQGAALRQAAASASSAVVVGSGFIGCEAAASLAMRGLSVTVVSQEQVPQQARLGDEAGERIATWLREAGIRYVGGVEVEAIVAGRRVEVSGAAAIEGDLLLVAAGIAPRVEMARTIGIELRRGRVPVDARMRTAVPHVLAAGDVALAHNLTAGRELLVEHFGEALAMGAVAGTTAAGGDATWSEVPGFWSDIGGRMLKYAAWGDGHDTARLVDHGAGAFTVWYGRGGTTVGVLTHDADEDYKRGSELVSTGGPLP